MQDYNSYEWKIGTEVIGKSKDIDVTCVVQYII